MAYFSTSPARYLHAFGVIENARELIRPSWRFSRHYTAATAAGHPCLPRNPMAAMWTVYGALWHTPPPASALDLALLVVAHEVNPRAKTPDEVAIAIGRGSQTHAAALRLLRRAADTACRHSQSLVRPQKSPQTP